MNEENSHHQKLAAIQRQTYVTMCMQIISTAFVIGVLVGDQHEVARRLVQAKLNDLERGVPI